MKPVLQFFWSVIILALIAYGALHFFQLPTGEVIDWIVGIASFLWLMVIVTVPWNAHFKAREVLDDAEISKRKDILVVDDALLFAKRIAKRSLITAILLHIVSAVGLYMFAFLGVSNVGIFAALAAILLTFLRPSVRFYDYVNQKLTTIKQEFRYPREDLHELLEKVANLETKVKNIEGILDSDPEKDSWRNNLTEELKVLTKSLDDQKIHIQEVDENNQGAVSKIKAEHDATFAKITADSKILDSVREIATFIKDLKN